MDWKKKVAAFEETMKIEPPSMGTSFIRFGFFGLVGGGKSVTAGVLAVAITPKDSLIGWIDGEGRRSGYAIDQLSRLAADHYKLPAKSFVDRIRVLHVDPPFDPLAGVAAINKLEAMGCKTIIADLCSQLWDSEGGYLDQREDKINQMAGEDYAKRNRVAQSAAAQVKPWTHGKFVSKVNACKANIVLVFQAKMKWNAKTNQPDGFYSPIQESGLTRLALAVGCVEQNAEGVGGFCKFRLPLGQGTKFTHPGLLDCLPGEGQQFTFGHGERIAAWCNGSSATSATVKAPTQPQTGGTAPAAGSGATGTSGRRIATDATRKWMINEMMPYGEGLLLTFFQQIGWLAPHETLADIALSHVPTSRQEMTELLGRIENFKATGNV